MNRQFCGYWRYGWQFIGLVILIFLCLLSAIFNFILLIPIAIVMWIAYRIGSRFVSQ